MNTFRIIWRLLASSPVFTLAAVLVLAFGVGVNTAVFSVVESRLLRPLPFTDADRLVRLTEGQDFLSGRDNTYELPEATYRQWRDHAGEVFTGIAASAPTSVTFGSAAGEPPQHLPAAMVTASFLPVHGLSPALGRNFLPAEDVPGGPAAVLISHEFWQQQFEGRRDVLGQTMELDGRPHTIVGVMPPDFRHPYRARVWVPLALKFHPATYRNRYLDAVARLKDGVSPEQADAALRRICADVNAAAPDPYNAKRAFVAPLREELIADLRPKLLIVYAAACGTLLIAALNFGGLLLAHAARRRKDFAIRIALGAAPAQVVRQALVVPVTLAFVGSLLGVLMAWWVTPLLLATSPEGADATGSALRDFDAGAHFNLPVLASASVSLLIVGAGAGLIPAWLALRTDPKSAMSRSSRGSGGDRGTQNLLAFLVAAEISLALVLLVGAGQLAGNYRALVSQPWGFAEKDRITFKVNFARTYPVAGPRSRAIEDIITRLRALPGVNSAAVTTPHPLHGEQDAVGNNPEGATPPEPRGYTFAYNQLISPGYFSAVGQPILQGRDFTPADHENAAFVCIVSEAYAKRAWPGQDPIGKRVKWGRLDNSKRPWFTVVGVAADSRRVSRDSYGAFGALYFLHSQFHSVVLSNDEFSFVLHTALPPAALQRTVRDELMRINPGLAAYDFAAVEELISQSQGSERYVLGLVAFFGALGMVMAGVGIYSLQSLFVTERTREFGVRLALGATSGQLIRSVLLRGWVILVAGVMLGYLGVHAFMRMSQAIRPDGAGLNMPMFLLTTGLLALMVSLASWLPAWRAGKVDPMISLQSE
jgi:predicted permease